MKDLQMNTRGADVVIVGAGAVGCAIAYFLSLRGLKVKIVERDAIAEHASGHAAGGFSPVISPTMNETSGMNTLPPYLIRESYNIHQRLYDELKEATGIDYHFTRGKRIALAFTDEEAARLKSWAQSQQMQGVADWLDNRDIWDLESRVSISIIGGAYLDHYRLESYKYVLALAQTAEKLGAEIRHGDVIGLQTKNQKVTALRLASGDIPCERVVLAMGPWTSFVSSWINLPVPVSPLKGQLVRLRVPGAPFPHVVTWGAFHMGTKPDGLVWAGSTQENVGYHEEPTVEGRDHILNGLLRMVPSLTDSEVVLQTACFRPVSRDGLPILGQAPRLDGVYLATGHGDFGILLSSITGRIMSELIVDGRTSTPIEAFAPIRFATNSNQPA